MSITTYHDTQISHVDELLKPGEHCESENPGGGI